MTAPIYICSSDRDTGDVLCSEQSRNLLSSVTEPLKVKKGIPKMSANPRIELPNSQLAQSPQQAYHVAPHQYHVTFKQFEQLKVLMQGISKT